MASKKKSDHCNRFDLGQRNTRRINRSIDYSWRTCIYIDRWSVKLKICALSSLWEHENCNVQLMNEYAINVHFDEGSAWSTRTTMASICVTLISALENSPINDYSFVIPSFFFFCLDVGNSLILQRLISFKPYVEKFNP